ncbi:Wzz/FepE/Etk N-terminal domain-containing protein [Thermus amyloliquefaciens]|uniref:Wzz/FepE/Etk N-terminal domain-containing protein n=1 Tax=Thermus amyloliquefaciens TaxID=1449080 RepID=UPI00057167D6|nr:Wzz/FepE/Etk N-terminal domain-containing protein [Thermus amyloliquefaciens]
MLQAPQEEFSLRDLVAVLERHRRLVVSLPLVLVTVALIYAFFIAEPRYASTATVNVAPVQVQAQLEQRIQVQGQNLLTFEGLKAIAFSEEVTREVWEALKRERKLPTAWQDQGGTPGLERMVKDFKIKNESPRQQVVPQGQVPPVVASLTVQAPSPEVAARTANLWAEAVTQRVNRIPLRRLEANLKALEEQILPAERTYREAQARWEAFQRASTLAQDKAELESKTAERVSLDQERSALERDLAAVQGRVAALEAEARKQASLVPIGTSPEQLAIIGKRLREAQENLKGETERARQAYVRAAQTLEVFKRQERIPVWQAELSAYTEAYASARSRSLALQKDLAVNATRLKEARARLEEYKAQVPGLSLENLVAGLTVAEAEALVAERLKEADGRLKAAEAAWQAYQRESQLAVLKQQLGGFADRVASIRQRLNVILTERVRVQEALGVARQRFEAFKAELPNLSLENLVAGLTVAEAEALVAERLKEADGRLKAAEAAWQAYQRESQLAVLKQQLGGFADRVASIRQRLEKIPTERAILQKRLAEAEAELAKEPKLLALEREVVADPAVAAAIARGGDLQALVGLKLKNQELNPTHQKLLFTALDLRADLGALEREEEALSAEVRRLEPEVQSLQERIAEEEARRARLATELDVARDIYNAVYRYAENLKRLAGKPELRLREVNPDVLRFRDQIIDLEIQLAALLAEEEALSAEVRRLEPEVQSLQERIAEEEARRARLATELDVARDIYNAVYRYAENLKRLAGKPELRLREVNPDVLRFRDEVVALEAERAALEAELRALEQNAQEYERRIQGLRAQIASQEREKESLLLEYNTKKAAYEAFRARYDQIANLTAQDLAFDNPNPEYQRLRSVLIDAQAEEARLLARKAALEARIAQVEARIALLRERVAKAQVEQDRVNQALELAKNAYLALSQKKTDLQIELASSQNALAQVIAPAFPVYEKVAPKRALILALAVFLGLVLGVMAAFLAEALRAPRTEAAG